jgi:hypothetical protein
MSKPDKPLDDEGVRQALAEACAKAGGQKNWAATNSVSTSYLNEVLKHQRPPGPAICRALGYKRRVEYVPDHWEHRDALQKDTNK